MEKFTHSKKAIEFYSITGVVLSSSKHSETNVWSSGGGGFVGKDGGYINSPQVHSNSVTCHEFWLMTDEKKEEFIQIKDAEIPLREGQKISIYFAKKEGESEWHHMLLVNHNAGKYWFTGGLPWKYVSLIRNNYDSNLGRLILYFSVSWVLLFIAIRSPEIATMLSFVFGFGFLIHKIRKSNRYTEAFTRHIELEVEKSNAGVKPA